MRGETAREQHLHVHGSMGFYCLEPQSDEARRWLNDHLAGEIHRSNSGGVYLDNVRYGEDILDGINAALGLEEDDNV